MIDAGLMPTDTAKPGGRTTGQIMSDYVIVGGKIHQAFSSITQNELSNLLLPYINSSSISNEPESESNEEK
jgi:hypothetical protein